MGWQNSDKAGTKTVNYFIKLTQPIEVKSGKRAKGCASFGDGKQITERAFDYCVFVTFDKHKEQDFLIFKVAELAELTKTSRKMGRYPNNQCILFKYNTLQDYESSVEPQNRLNIEMNLHKEPENYMLGRVKMEPRIIKEKLDF